jgi:simple sugar transport system substrate-binding protein
LIATSFKTLLRGALAVALLASASLAMPGVRSAHADEAKKLKIIVVSGPPFLAFFAPLKMGVDEAAKNLGVDVQYAAPSSPANPGGDTAQLLRQALVQKPDAIVTGDFFPDAEEPVLQDIMKAGIPLVIHNSGREFALKQTGVFVGDESTSTGLGMGQRQAAAGVKHGLCVIHTPGLPTLEQFCAGYAAGLKEGGGVAENLTIPGTQSTNPTALVQAIRGALQSNPAIDGIFTLDAQQSLDAVQAVDAAGKTGKIFVGSLVLSNPNLELLKEGKIGVLVDLQPFMQGYYSVLIAAQWVRYGLHPVGQVSTAPLFVTKDDADRVIQINKSVLGIRGPA